MNNLKVVRRLAFTLPVLALLSTHAHAGFIAGKIISLYPDPDDFVVELSVPGPCGSKFFHFKRSALNFKEAVATAMIAFSLNKNVQIMQTSCGGDRNISSHMGAYN